MTDIKINEPQQDIDEFFKQQLMQQSMQANSGWVTLQQTIVAAAAKAAVEHDDKAGPLDLSAINGIMELSQKMQMNLLEVMEATKKLSE